MSSAFGTLSGEHEAQVHRFLRFLRAKRDIAVTAIESEFNDIKNDRLDEDTYNVTDVASIVDALCAVVRADVRRELSAVVNMASLLLTQVLQAAERQGAQCTIDPAVVEDAALLEEIERLRADCVVTGAGNGRGGAAAGGTSRLVSIKDEHAALLQAKDRLEASNKALQERAAAFQQECSAALAGRDALQREVRDLRRQLESRADPKNGGDEKVTAGAKDATEEAATALDVSRKRANDLAERLAAAEEESSRRVADSAQFRQLKKLLSTKSAQVVGLRRRLAEYEPNGGDGDDDDAVGGSSGGRGGDGKYDDDRP